MMTLRLPAICTIALLAPVAIVAAGLAWIAGGERVGATPFAGPVARNSAEAAGRGSAVDVMRFLRSGEDPRRVYATRPEMIASGVERATTLEAAMWSRQLELIQLLDGAGAIDGDGERRALACLAADLEIDDVVEYLAPDGVAHCEPGRAYERVLARTSAMGGGQ